VIGALIAGALVVTGAAPPESGVPDLGNIEAEATVTNDDPPPPPPECWWSAKPADATDRAREQGFWRQIDGGEHYDDVLVFFEDGTLRRTFITIQKTYVYQVRVCSDPAHEDQGLTRWAVVGPPNPTVLWDELTERVTRRVPLPAPNLGFEMAADGSVRVAVQVGLWVAVDNPDDVVARAEPAPGVWAETRATLESIEFLSGTGGTSGPCVGGGTPLPPDEQGTVEQGPCGYTYTTVDELGRRVALIRAIWTVTSSASTGATERRPDIVLETAIPVDVYEIQTVGTG
jgi:hypothetical protein